MTGSSFRKGQMEMIGLVIIVILLTLGMLFLAQFALNKSPEKKIFTRKGLAYSTMGAMMKTTIIDPDCVRGFAGHSFPHVEKDLLEDCALYYDTAPGGYSVYTCDQQHSCLFLQQQLTVFLNDTLGRWNKRYEFNSQLLHPQDNEPTTLLSIQSAGGCPKTRERDSSELFFLQTEAGLVESVLYLCD